MLITKVIISVRITIFYELYSILLAYQKILLISLVYINGFNRSGLIAAPLRIILVGTLPRLSFTSEYSLFAFFITSNIFLGVIFH